VIGVPPWNCRVRFVELSEGLNEQALADAIGVTKRDHQEHSLREGNGEKIWYPAPHSANRSATILQARSCKVDRLSRALPKELAECGGIHALRELAKRSRHEAITLVYGAADEQYNEAVALKESIRLARSLSE
jgi:hypothetical protein